MKLLHLAAPLLTAASLANAAAIALPQSDAHSAALPKRDARAEAQNPQPPGPGQCQELQCFNDQVCYSQGCGSCLQSSGGGVCLDPATSKRDVDAAAQAIRARAALEKRDALAKAQNPQPPGPGQCQELKCFNDQVCYSQGCGSCLQSSGGGVCLDPATSKRDVEAAAQAIRAREAAAKLDGIFRRD